MIYRYTVLVVVLVCSIQQYCLAQDSRQDPAQQNGKLQKGLDPTCGTLNDLARKVEICADPLMSILEGRIKKWPRTEKDAGDLCASFQQTEKCIKDLSRRCAKGLQKTIISTLAHSVQRARKRECSRAKYPQVLRMTGCVEKNQEAVKALMANATNRLNVVEYQMTNLDTKTTGLCLMVYEIKHNIQATLTPRCPNEVNLVVALYDAIVEDVTELVCRRVQSKDIFKGYVIPKVADGTGIVSVLLRIVFSLGGENAN